MKADIEIVDEIKAGQKQLFSQLVDRHQRSLLRLTMRFTRNLGVAEEIVQDAFLKAYQKLDTYEGRSSFKSWLYQIAVNTAKNHLRKNKIDSVKIESIQIAVDSKAHAAVEETDLKTLIRQHIDILPEKQKAALILRVFEDLSFKEIAQIMKCPYDTAKANYRHAIMKLRHKLAEDQFLKDFQEPNREPVIRAQYAEAEQ